MNALGLTPDAARGLRVIVLHGLEVQARLGIHPHEAVPQRVVIDIALQVVDEAAPNAVGEDAIPRVLNYERVAQAARAIATAGHIMLVETLAERIAVALLRDARVRRVRVSAAKPDVFADIRAVGVVVERVAAVSVND